MLWLCLRFANLPLEVFLDPPDKRSHGSPEGRPRDSAIAPPMAVVDRHRIITCNQSAHDAGITPQITPATARALCDEIRIFTRQPEREAQTLRSLAYSCYRFTPLIDPLEPDCLLLEVGSSLRLFQGLNALLRQLHQLLRELGFSHEIGIAPTPRAAELMSHTPPAVQKQLVSIFSSSDQEDHQQQLQSQTGISAYSDILHRFPLADLLCPNPLKKQFRASGLQRLGELIQLPGDAIGKRFGAGFLNYLQQLTGNRPDPRPHLQLPAEFDDILQLNHGITSAEALAFPMKRLLSALCGYLQGRQLHCQQLNWHLQLLNGSSERLTIRFSRPQNQLDHFLSLSRLQLEKIRFYSPVDALRLQVTHLHQAQPVIGDLFGKHHHDQLFDPAANSDLIDRLTSRLGPEAVSGVAATDSHIPEQAGLVAPTGSGLLPLTEPDPDPRLLRPLWLLPEPESICCDRGQLEWRGVLDLLQGPERVEGNWWQQPICRDYFIARHPGGAHYWVYQERASRRWFVHGVFG